MLSKNFCKFGILCVSNCRKIRMLEVGSTLLTIVLCVDAYVNAF